MCLELSIKTTSFILDNFCLFVVLIKWINEFNRFISYLSFVFCILEIQQTHSGICLSPYKKLCYYFECIQYDQFIWFFTLTWIDLELFELRAEIRDRDVMKYHGFGLGTSDSCYFYEKKDTYLFRHLAIHFYLALLFQNPTECECQCSWIYRSEFFPIWIAINLIMCLQKVRKNIFSLRFKE